MPDNDTQRDRVIRSAVLIGAPLLTAVLALGASLLVTLGQNGGHDHSRPPVVSHTSPPGNPTPTASIPATIVVHSKRRPVLIVVPGQPGGSSSVPTIITAAAGSLVAVVSAITGLVYLLRRRDSGGPPPQSS